MWESRKMLFGENAIRRPQLAANGQQLIVRSLADYTVGLARGKPAVTM